MPYICMDFIQSQPWIACCLLETKKEPHGEAKGPFDEAHRPFDLRLFAQACYRWTPQIALRGEQGVFLHLSACRKLYSETGFKRRVEALAKRFGVRVQMGFATDAPTALALARIQGSEFLGSHRQALLLDALLDYASPFQWDADLHACALHMREVLKKLGLKTLGDFLALPQDTLASRFGEKGLEMRARVHGHFLWAWPAWEVPERIMETQDLEEEVGGEALLFVLKGLVDRAMARLRGLGQRAVRIEVRVLLKGWSTVEVRNRTWSVAFAFPQGSTSSVMPVIQERIFSDLQASSLSAPLERVELEVQEGVPGNQAQKNFFSQQEEEQERWEAWVNRLVVRLGKEHVFLAAPVNRYLPEGAWGKEEGFSSWNLRNFHEGRGVKNAADPFEQASGSVAAEEKNQETGQGLSSETRRVIGLRPTRVLKKPQPFRLSHPHQIQVQGKTWKARKWSALERIAGEWWRDPQMQGFHRDYYQVSTETGEELWVFLDRNQNPPVFFLHGYFD
ncbi:MAG: hypothetical protein ACO3A2_07545 [Bdellovibrionia bacterium]